MSTDTSEAGLEAIIVRSLVEESGYVEGSPGDYDREHAVDLAQLRAFVSATQPEKYEALGLGGDGPALAAFLGRLQGEVRKRSVVDVLRNGVKHNATALDLFYGTPSPGNEEAAALNAQNVFGVTRQLRYGRDERRRALDLCLFVNGLPVATFELKNSLTNQTAADAEEQYRRDRDAGEPLFRLGVCLVHFAVDDAEVRMCTHLRGRDSWFLPFNKGRDDGAGNPPNPRGIRTDYLWRETLAKPSLGDVIENYAQVVGDGKGRKLIFPRYHQLGAVRKLLADAAKNGAGRRYLVQHSAGSGKSNSIAWLAHQLVGLQHRGRDAFDATIVVTDRTALDRQIRDTIRQFAQVSSVVGHAGSARELADLLRQGKKIVVSTIQKFPFAPEAFGAGLADRRYAILIDEAHSGQGGRATTELGKTLSGGDGAGGEDGVEPSYEDQVNAAIESRRLLPNASYFAFTATPKNKTVELFGEAGTLRPFHAYTMKQAVQEGFIRDVLARYTTARSYYRLAKKVEDDPEFDARRAEKRLRRYVESHPHAVAEKARIAVDHFLDAVVAKRKLGGRARGMVVCDGIGRAVDYFHAVAARLEERGSPHRAIVAFSGEHEHGGARVTEATLNGFPSSRIPESLREPPYRLLVAADKFQTGFDEPLLYAMYVDKPLSGVRAVQTLSRLNRAHPAKDDPVVLDFFNDAEAIRAAFEPYYRVTSLEGPTDPNRLHDLKADLDAAQVYAAEEVDSLVRRFLAGDAREALDPILDACAARYVGDLDEEGQAGFKGDAKGFVRTYGFLAAVLPYGNPEWEKLAAFLTLLVPKLPAPEGDDLSAGVLRSIDMDSYRAEVGAATAVELPDAEGTLAPVPAAGAGGTAEPELRRLSEIVAAFNRQFAGIDWKDADRVRRVVEVELPAAVAADAAYANAMRNSGGPAARLEHDAAVRRAMGDLLADNLDLFKQFSDNESFRRSVLNFVFGQTYRPPGAAGDAAAG